MTFPEIAAVRNLRSIFMRNQFSPCYVERQKRGIGIAYGDATRNQPRMLRDVYVGSPRQHFVGEPTLCERGSNQT